MRGQGGGPGDCFFFNIDILFHQCNDKNIIYQQFYCCLRCIFYTEFILLYFGVFFPSPEKLQFSCKKSIFCWFYMELNALQTSSRIFFLFHLFLVNKIQNITKLYIKRKISEKKFKYFSKFYFSKI